MIQTHLMFFSISEVRVRDAWSKKVANVSYEHDEKENTEDSLSLIYFIWLIAVSSIL